MYPGFGGCGTVEKASPKCREAEFCELRVDGVLGSTPEFLQGCGDCRWSPACGRSLGSGVARMGARPRAGRSLAARMDNAAPLGGFGPLVTAYHKDRAGGVADNRIGDAPLDGPPYPPVASATHHDQAYPELVGQGYDLQVHYPQPEVGTGHGSASDLHPPGQLSKQLPRLLFDLLVELAVVA